MRLWTNFDAMAPSASNRIAAIDVGTNSFHMVIATVSARGSLRIHHRNKELVRLGMAAGDIKKLSPEAIQRGVKTLKRFKAEAEQHGAQIRAVATSAVREAVNREEFVDRVFKATGIEVEVVSGIEEGRLIYVGAMHALPIITKRALVIDIGGGSTETVIGHNGTADVIHSAKLGHLRVMKGFFPEGKATAASLEACRTAIRGDWSPVLQDLVQHGYEEFVGSSGTVLTIAAMTLARLHKRIPESLNGLKLLRSDVMDTIATICDARTVEQRMQLPGIDVRRADVILGGALLLEAALVGLDAQQMTISNYALREGIVFDTARKQRDINEYHHLATLRYQSVHHLCDVYRVRRAHAEHVKMLALSLFDSLRPLHPFGDKEREVLEAAALLHDIGFHSAADQHHKHSEYIIRHSAMPGFTNDETELIASVARYHRKSFPKKKHEIFGRLHPDEQRVVRTLASILRIAEGLDRRGQQLIRSVAVQVSKERIDITVHAPGPSPDIELWGAERRKGLMAQVFGREVRFLGHAVA